MLSLLLPLSSLLLPATPGAAAPGRSDDFVLGEMKVTGSSLPYSLEAYDIFGSSSAALRDLNGDGIEDLAVGAPYDDDGGPSCGAVWVLFLNADGTVKSERKVSATAGGFGGTLDVGDFLGSSLSGLGDLDGDGIEDLAVGASGDDDGGANRGAAWILFLNANGTVKSEQKISTATGGFGGLLDSHDFFGTAVAALGDLDGDGIEDLAVGARGDDDGGGGSISDRGAVWILFLNADGTVKYEQKISATAGGFGGALDDYDEFATSLGALGDLDGDAIEDLAVGAPYDDDGGSNRGAVWILFSNADGTVKNEQKISATMGGLAGALQNGDRFGSSLGGLGDMDGDGLGDLVVGAPGVDDGGTYYSDRGAVWILILNGDGMVKSEQKISATAGGFGGGLDSGDSFGAAVAAAGDLDSDGVGDLVVGAPYDDDGGESCGAVWILFLNADGMVRDEKKISATAGGFGDNLEAYDRFASSLAMTGDLDQDGVAEILVGVPGHDPGGPDRGAVWMLFLEPDGTVGDDRRWGEGSGGGLGPLADGDLLGAAVAGLGDLDGDGRPELLGGAPGTDDGGVDRGAVWVLFLDASFDLDRAAKISATSGGLVGPLDDGDAFGLSASALGDLDGDGLEELAVGAPGDDDGGAACGAVWILFLDASGAVRSERKISATAGGFGGVLLPGDSFGRAVAGVGDLDGDGIEELAVGAPGDDGPGIDRGAVWLLYLDASGAVRAETELTAEPGFPAGELEEGDWLGVSLASGADFDGYGLEDLVVGASQDDDGGADRGAVWVVLLHETSSVFGAVKVSATTGGFGGWLDTGDRFGSAVALPGDLNGDSYEDMIVGAPFDDDGGADCGAAWVLHCDEILTSSALAIWRNGSGINPDVFLSTSLPILGTEWTSTVDGGAVGATGLVLVAGYDGAHPGLWTPYGELLLDPTSEYAFSDWRGLAGGPMTYHSVSVPSDLAFLGVRVTTQAMLNNVAGRPVLANAWDLVLGF
ncbi:MAG: integrin alpha [Planctomycetota bacterium]